MATKNNKNYSVKTKSESSKMIKKRVLCLVCKKPFANINSLGNHKRKFHTESLNSTGHSINSITSLDSGEIEREVVQLKEDEFIEAEFIEDDFIEVAHDIADETEAPLPIKPKTVIGKRVSSVDTNKIIKQKRTKEDAYEGSMLAQKSLAQALDLCTDLRTELKEVRAENSLFDCDIRKLQLINDELKAEMKRLLTDKHEVNSEKNKPKSKVTETQKGAVVVKGGVSEELQAAESKNEQLARELSSANAELEKLELKVIQFESLQTEKQLLQTTNDQLKSEKIAIQSKLTETEAKIMDIEIVSSDFRTAKLEIEQLAKVLKGHESINGSLNEELVNANADIDQLNKQLVQLDSIQKELQQLKSSNDQLNLAQIKLKSKLSESEAEIKCFKANSSKLKITQTETIRLADLLVEYESFDERMKQKLNVANDIIRKMKRSLMDVELHHAETEKELISELTSAMKQLNIKDSQLKTARNEISRLADELNNSKMLIEEYKIDIKTAHSEVEEFKEKLSVANSIIRKMKRKLMDVELHHAEVEKKRTAELNSAIEQLNIKDSQLQTARSEISQLADDLNNSKMLNEEYKVDLIAARSEVEKLRPKLAELQLAQAQIENLQAQVESSQKIVDRYRFSRLKSIAQERKEAKRVEAESVLQTASVEATISTDLVLDFDPVNGKILLMVDQGLVAWLKEHQRNGIKFMWENCYGSIEALKSSYGSGCILAHCPGLGKTLQVVALIYTLLTNTDITEVKTILIFCPKNTTLNWVKEFEIWIARCKIKQEINVYNFSGIEKIDKRFAAVREWHLNGGVAVCGYETFLSLLEKGSMFAELCVPGPDLIVCDEGHRLKDRQSQTNIGLSKIRTWRRILLTGTPIQNNLEECFAMIKFIKPNLQENDEIFKQCVSKSTISGQYKESQYDSEHQELNSQLSSLSKKIHNCIHRRDESVLRQYLFGKFEFSLSVKLTNIQADMYEHYIKNRFELHESKKDNVLSHYNNTLLISTHPGSFNFKNKSSLNSKEKIAKWWEDFALRGVNEEILKEYDFTQSNKMALLCEILKICAKRKDKVLVFSQSLTTLTVIEYFLEKMNSETGDWQKNVNYYRMDGEDKCVEHRELMCEKFNDPDEEDIRLFLISTKAGGIGINLTGANRVIIFDPCWNPTHDVQCIYRAYRLGQTKTVVVYRLITVGTFEEKVHKRQIMKGAMTACLMDGQRIDRLFSQSEIQDLFDISNIRPGRAECEKYPGKDAVLAEIMRNSSMILGWNEVTNDRDGNNSFK